MRQLEELCAWQEGEKAIRGFKKGKGVGVDGFDGYVLRVMGAEMHRIFWETLRDIRQSKR